MILDLKIHYNVIQLMWTSITIPNIKIKKKKFKPNLPINEKFKIHFGAIIVGYFDH